MAAGLAPSEQVSQADWMHLDADEEVLWTGRPSRFTIAVGLVGGVIIAFVGIGLTLLFQDEVSGLVSFAPLVVTVIGLGIAAFVYLDWLRLLYVITDAEIYVKYGLLSRNVTQIRLSRVQNTTFEQSVPERILGYGDVRIYTAGDGTEDLTLRSVPGPQQVIRLLSDSLPEGSQGV